MMVARCECIIIKHKARCGSVARYRCNTCGDRLCRMCAVEHHAHRTMTPLPERHEVVKR